VRGEAGAVASRRDRIAVYGTEPTGTELTLTELTLTGLTLTGLTLTGLTGTALRHGNGRAATRGGTFVGGAHCVSE